MEHFYDIVVLFLWTFSSMDLVIVRGKSVKNTRAFVLIPPDVKQALELLCNTRDAYCTPSTNKYMFPRKTSDTPVSGTVVMKEMADNCPLLDHPERIRSTKLRKYIATLSQVGFCTPHLFCCFHILALIQHKL